MVFDIENSSKSSKANLQLYQLNGGDNQKFSITQNNGYYSITNINSNKSVDVSGGYATNKTNVWQYDVNASKAQQWIFVDAGNGYYYIKSALGTYIDAKDGKAFDGNNIWMYGYNGTVAQQWKLIPVDSVNSSELRCKHSWNYGCEYKHPHRDYRICSKCGEKEYTNNGSYNSTCSECNPTCSHTWGYGCENAHPHRDFKICQKCGEMVYTNSGTYDSSCAKCNPTCNHAWTIGNDSAHPHNEYRVCTKCGEKSYTGKTGYSGSCSTCTYTPSWGAWSDWSTASVSESSTRQVETKTQYVYYHYYLTYDDNHVGTYPINMSTANENFKNFVNAHVKAESYHEYFSDSQLTLCSGRLVYAVNGQSVVWDKYVNNCAEDTGAFGGNANFLYYKGTRTLYRYRDYK